MSSSSDRRAVGKKLSLVGAPSLIRQFVFSVHTLNVSLTSYLVLTRHSVLEEYCIFTDHLCTGKLLIRAQVECEYW